MLANRPDEEVVFIVSEGYLPLLHSLTEWRRTARCCSATRPPAASPGWMLCPLPCQVSLDDARLTGPKMKKYSCKGDVEVSMLARSS